MYKAILKVSLLILGITSLSFISYHVFKLSTSSIGKSVENSEEHIGPGMAPGWVEQWRTMKGLKEGEEVPFGLFSKWLRADRARANKRQDKTELHNVKEIGPIEDMGGRTRDMLIDYADSSRIIACGISGGVWEGKDFGKEWRPINDFAATLSATCITQSPFEHSVMYYGTGEGAANSAGIPGEGVFKSSDGGKTFNQLPSTLNSNFNYTWDIKHSLVDTNTLFVATVNRGLWRSTNAGDSFERVFVSSTDIHDIEVFNDSTILISVESRGIYRSKTGDVGSWEKLSNGLPSTGYSRIDITYSDSFPNVIYALFALGTGGYNGSCIGVYKSSNGGNTWTYQGNPGDFSRVSFSFPWYCMTIVVDPNDTNKLAVGSVNYGYSFDGGKTWNRAQYSHADYHVQIFRRDIPGTFLVGNDGGIYQYTWSSIATKAINRNENYNVHQVYAGSFTPDSNGVLVGAQDQNSTYSKDGRGKFTLIYGGDGAFCHVHQQNPDVAYASSQNGNLVKTGSLNNAIPSAVRYTNNLDLSEGVWFINPFEMNYLNGDQLFFPTKRRLWMTYDGGQYWAPISNPKSNLYSVGIPYNKNPKRIYFGGDNLWILRIEDPINTEPGDEVSLRKNFPSELTNGFISCITVNPEDDGIIYLTMSNYSSAPKVWRIDSAHTDEPIWSNISGDLPEGLPANWIEVDPYRPDSFLIAATDFGLYVTKNGGKNWIKESRIPNVTIPNIRMRYTDRKLFVFTHGRGTWSMNLKNMEDPFIGIDEKKDDAFFAVYPNPASSFINLKFETESEFSYQIFDLNGKVILTGKNNTQIDVNSLKLGNYNITVEANNKRYSRLFVKE